MGRDRYEALGVPPDANQTQIRNAYRRKAKELHPDATGGGDDTAFCEVQAAYDTLSDPAARRRYDRDREPTPRSSRRPVREAADTHGETPCAPGTFGMGALRFGRIFDEFFGRSVRPAEFDLSLSPAEAARGVKLRLEIDRLQTAIITIPPGVRDGQVLRSAGAFGDSRIVVYVTVR